MRSALIIPLLLGLAAPAAAIGVPQTRPSTMAPGFYMAVVDGEVVLAAGALPGLGDGPARVVSRSKAVIVLRRPSTATTPSLVAAWRGLGIRLYGLAGPVCEGKVLGFELVGRTSGAGDTDALWYRAERTIVAKLDTKPGTCKGALFARAADAPDPQLVAPAVSPDKDLIQAAGTGPGTLKTVQLGDTLYAAWRQTADGCGPLTVYERDKKGTLHVVSSPSLRGMRVGATGDLDGDLIPELLLEGGGVLRRARGGTYELVDPGSTPPRCAAK